MAHYRSCGDIPPKRHTQHRRPDGGLYYEELMGEEGFSSDSSLLYHTGVPSAIVDAMTWEPGDLSTTPNHPLKPRHLRLHDLFPGEDWKAVDAVTGRRLVLGNAEVRISYVAAGEASPLYRNAAGDECVYVEAGAGTVQTVFGTLPVRAGDYVILPRSTTHRWIRRIRSPGPEPLRCYVIEANSHITPPQRYLSRYGQFLEHAPYCERDLHGPESPSEPVRSANRAPMWTCWSSTGPRAGRSSAPGTCTRPTRSMWSAGTAACTRTRSTSGTSSRSPGGCTSRRPCIRCSRAAAS